MISTNVIHIQSYLEQNHPAVAEELLGKLASQPCDHSLVSRVVSLSSNATDERWQLQVVAIASALLLCSPETIYVGCSVRRSSGVATLLGKCLGVSHVSISKKVDRARHYYTHVGWCREMVDKIVKEVRDNE